MGAVRLRLVKAANGASECKGSSKCAQRRHGWIAVAREQRAESGGEREREKEKEYKWASARGGPQGRRQKAERRVALVRSGAERSGRTGEAAAA